MKWKKIKQGIEYTGTAFILLIFLSYVIISGYKIFYPEKEKVITFNIIGIVNSTNATTLTQLHFECIKFCGKEISYSQDAVIKCYEQCSSLGKEK
jgi:hypothetical protein